MNHQIFMKGMNSDSSIQIMLERNGFKNSMTSEGLGFGSSEKLSPTLAL